MKIRGVFSDSVCRDPASGTFIDVGTVEESLKSAYRQAHTRYRRDDEREVVTENHRRLSAILSSISLSFQHPISVLDAGCGTGRYFHCVENAERLVGIDLSPEMLKAAETPVRSEQISTAKIELLCGNLHLLSFPPQSFDFIYSLGVFGHGCPLTVELCDKFYEWLGDRGKLFFNAVDTATLPLAKRARRRLRHLLLPLLPRRWRTTFKQRESRLPFFGLTLRSLAAILRASRFTRFSLSRHVCHSPLWKGIHLECLASK